MTTEPLTRSVERCVLIHASRATVFRSLLDPAGLSRWMYANVRWTPTRGSSYRIEWKDTAVPAVAQGEILEIEQDRRLVLSWFMERDGIETTASFDLEDEEDERTAVRFRHSGFPEREDWPASRIDMIALEWDKVLENLRFEVEEGTGGKPFYARIEQPLLASRERANLYWVAPSCLVTWLAREAFLDPAAGSDFEFRLREGGEARGTIRTFLPGRHLRLVWEENGVRSLLGLSFWPTAAGCMMTLTQRSYGIDEGDRARVLATWEARFARLREAIERPVAAKEAQGSGSIALTQIVLADPAETYRCFTDPGRLIGWFCDRAEFTASVDHPFAFLWTGYGENRGVVEDLAPGERLRLRWEVAALHATTTLSIQLAPAGVDGSSTQVSLRHTGFPGDDVGEGERAAHEAGWRSFLSLLDVYLREYGRGPRRSFLLRRRLQLSASDAVARLTTSEGLASWLGAVVALDARDDGAIRVKLPDGTVLGGRFAMLSPEIGLSLELEEPEMLFLSVWWEGTDHQISVALEGIAYGVPESWPLRQRIVWGERLDRLAGLA